MKIKKDTIVRIIKSKKNRPLTGDDISRLLRLTPDEYRELERVLAEMEASGTVIRVKNGRYAVPKELGLIVGRLEVNPRGFGFVVPEEERGEDIYVHKEDMGTALHGDTVLVRLESSPRGRRSHSRAGSVVRVIRRGSGVIVGTLKKSDSHFYLIPDNPSFIHDIYVDRARTRDAGPEEKVTVRITGWPSKRLNPEGEVVEVLGRAGVPEVDTLSAIREYGIREEYPEAVLEEAARAPARIPEEETRARTDLRGLTLFTVDPEDARDFDDAVSIEKKPDGKFILGVHIADVSHYVREDSVLDAEARERGTSVYLPARAIHMLPPRLATGICSLQPGEDRLAKSVLITFSPEGERLDFRFHRSVIKSHRRFTYEEVRKILVEKDAASRSGAPELTALLDEMAVLARRLREARFARGAFDLDLPEAKIIFDERGLISDVRLEESDLAHWLIEEFMVAANEAAAEFLAARRAPLIYRVHDEPSGPDLEEFREFASAFGYTIKNPRDRREVQSFLDSVRETPLATTLQTAFLRSLKQAEYSAKNIGHFGLASPRYAYFTSPIRRYPDLHTHRLLEYILQGKTPPPEPELKELARHCSETERNAEKAEREMLQLRKLQFFARHLEGADRPVFTAVITRIKNFGLIVYLNRYLISGLVHVSTLTDDFYRIDRSGTRLRGRRTGREFTAGDVVTVRAEKVDRELKQVDFIIFSAPNKTSGRKK
ncbi:MAG: ribonuclease R [PVC group bacterium]